MHVAGIARLGQIHGQSLPLSGRNTGTDFELATGEDLLGSDILEVSIGIVFVFVVSLVIVPSDDYELFVRFTSGQLPFNPTSDQAIEVGFATNIQALADFLAQ